MGAFYVSIIFLGILLIIGSLFFIAMDKVNGKEFFKEFDRKKEEMFNLIQDSEDMIQELNKISDYVVTTISEKNQEFFERVNRQQGNVVYQPTVRFTETQNTQSTDNGYNTVNAPEYNIADNTANAGNIDNTHNADNSQISHHTYENGNNKSEPVFEQQTLYRQNGAQEVHERQESQEDNLNIKRELNTQMSDITERMNETNQSRLVLNSKRREVLKMIEQGMSNDEIADKLKIGKGEIGLIRGLSK